MLCLANNIHIPTPMSTGLLRQHHENPDANRRNRRRRAGTGSPRPRSPYVCAGQLNTDAVKWGRQATRWPAAWRKSPAIEDSPSSLVLPLVQVRKLTLASTCAILAESKGSQMRDGCYLARPSSSWRIRVATTKPWLMALGAHIRWVSPEGAHRWAREDLGTNRGTE